MVRPAWTPDGRAIAYLSGRNIWTQPVDGGRPSQLSHFSDDKAIGDFAWSHDGKQLAVTRTTSRADIVLLKIRDSQ
jgi:TolB protein